MLTAYSAFGQEEGLPAAREALWLDLLDPTNEERASVENRYGLKLPSRPELSEVETSRRVSEENGVLAVRTVNSLICRTARAPLIELP
jgi:Mg2+ and Co2+ transporter CorA